MAQVGIEQPRIAWVGPTPPAALAAELVRLGRVVGEDVGEAEVVVVWGAVGPGALHALPDRAPGTPVIVVEPPDGPRERLAWIEAGADELVAVGEAAEAVRRRLRGAGRREAARRGAGGDGPEEAAVGRFGGLAGGGLVGGEGGLRAGGDLTGGGGLVGAEDRPGLGAELASTPDPAAPPASTPRRGPAARRSSPADPFPAVPVDGARPEDLAAAHAWARGLQRYVQERHAFLRRFGKEALPALLEVARLRDRVPRPGEPEAAANLFGQRPGEDADLGWAAVVRRAVAGGTETAAARVRSVGTDGLVVDAGFRCLPRQRVVVDLPVDGRTNAQLMGEARMQRRVALDRWQVGLFVMELRFREVER